MTLQERIRHEQKEALKAEQAVKNGRRVKRNKRIANNARRMLAVLAVVADLPPAVPK